MASMKHLHPYGNSQPNHFQINTDVSTWFIEDKRVYRVENISYVSEWLVGTNETGFFPS